MISTQPPEGCVGPREAKQWIKKKLANSLKCLQKRYVNSDSVVSSEDSDANDLCCAVEAVFVHGLQAKHVGTEGGNRGRKANRAALPQPVFWSLLKSVTHRNVVTELERLCFISSDVGRCRAWVRLALNEGLLECYLVSLLRERETLCDYYQPVALLLDMEESEVLISYLQGLASLSFELSYKSAVLNVWTTSPLAWAGLCPPPAVTELEPPSSPAPRRRGSWDSTSPSDSSDVVSVTHMGSGSSLAPGARHSGKDKLTSSSLSLETTGSSSQLSSSLSSDSLPQANGVRSPEPTAEENWPCDLDREIVSSEAACRPPGGVFSTTGTGDCVTDCVPEAESGSQPPGSPLDSQPSSETPSPEPPASPESDAPIPTELPSLIPRSTLPGGSGAVYPKPEALVGDEERAGERERGAAGEPANGSSGCLQNGSHRAVEPSGLHKSASWISEDDICQPVWGEEPEPWPQTSPQENGTDLSRPALDLTGPHHGHEDKLFEVTHRRKAGISNPFRGLLKLGNLERRGPVGIWKEFYCELSPFEFRLYLNDESRTCYENCSLLRCEAVLALGDGRFELLCSGRRLCLRAASPDEAEDWTDRIREALVKCRPQNASQRAGGARPRAAPGGEERQRQRPAAETAPRESLSPDWVCRSEPQLDAIKETVLCVLVGERWLPCVCSLSLEALICSQLRGGKRELVTSCRTDSFRDVVPDTALGGPAYFKLVTSGAALQLQAENGEEARAWRELIRAVLTCHREAVDGVAGEEGADERNGQRLVQLGLGEYSPLLRCLTAVPNERGLDQQNQQCAGCPRRIGFSFGKLKLCAFSGLYYCESCHHDTEVIIPSRVIHNWDLKKRGVCDTAARFLQQIGAEPFLDVVRLNGSLYQHVEQMAQALRSRERLKLLEEYLLTCRSGALQELYRKIDGKNYLLESPHLYSVSDLRLIARGVFEAFLQHAIQFASNHVYMCDLCTQRGFICLLCNCDDIIFPFEFESTTRCRDCKAVFHKVCKASEPCCPRCEWRQRHQEPGPVH
eukprot:gi/632977797/ref/XP_007905547.1/ PREDICTED: pleckstrin homology domain-containing family M member 1 [Callorhinchus milii]